MIGREKRVLLRHYLEQGLSRSEIARKLRCGFHGKSITLE